jgi:putative tryptophan/tyrosine transport system substrate-binding protein
MRRRDLIAALAGVAASRSIPLAAQQTARRTVAVLSSVSADSTQQPDSLVPILMRRLSELGDVNGKNIDVQFRFADGDYQRLPLLAAELVAWKPDAIYTWTTPAGRAAAGATSTIPIVIGPASVVTMRALVPDFAHPAGNITGLYYTGPEEHGKCLALLKEVVPGVTRVGVLFNPLNQAWQGYPDVLDETARPLGIELVGATAHGPADVDQAFAEMMGKGVNGLLGLSDATLTGGDAQTRIIELIASNRLPSVSDDGAFVTGGGLLSIAPDEAAISNGAAEYLHRILQGAKPGELPVLGPKLLLSVNLGAAGKLGITIPQPVLARANVLSGA